MLVPVKEGKGSGYTDFCSLLEVGAVLDVGQGKDFFDSKLCASYGVRAPHSSAMKKAKKKPMVVIVGKSLGQ